MKASFIPARAIIRSKLHETKQIATFRLELLDKTIPFTFTPGQFLMLSVPHCGEAAISISSSPDTLPLFDLSIRKAGTLTSAIHKMQVNEQVGVRGPFGTPFPVEECISRDLIVIAGGIGLAPLKSVVDHLLFLSSLEEETVNKITALYGSQTPSELAFTTAMDNWQKQGVIIHTTVDSKEDGWSGNVGLVTDLLDFCAIPSTSAALVCGPPLMIQAVTKRLTDMGMAAENIYTTLERHMKCGMGICGHCHMDDKLVCIDGPVFSISQLQALDVMEFAT